MENHLMQKNFAHIDNWREYNGTLVGHISGHINQANFSKEYQRTSRLINLDVVNNVAETQNTFYSLGTPHVEE